MLSEVIGYDNMLAVTILFILLCVFYVAGYREGAKSGKQIKRKFAKSRKSH